jgi:RNA polymerase sigma-70 factor, ECF subfamily
VALVASRVEIEFAESDEPPPSAAREQQMTPLVSRAIRRAQAGDQEALCFLYSRYADDVCGHVRSIVHDPYEAEDVTQQLFTKLLRVIGKYEERDVPFFVWLLRVARNLAVDPLRRQRVVPVEEVRATTSHSGDTVGRERMTDLREALAELPKDQCEVLVLRHLAGLSPKEIATLTGRSEGSVHGLHHRGRRALRVELAERGAGLSTVARGPRRS